MAAELYYAASEIVDDFDDYGPVIQANIDGEYDDSTAIVQLRNARAAIIEAIRALPRTKGAERSG